jgi:hypothetical protein
MVWIQITNIKTNHCLAFLGGLGKSSLILGSLKCLLDFITVNAFKIFPVNVSSIEMLRAPIALKYMTDFTMLPFTPTSMPI